ncbi:MAG: iron-binding protein [Planctomycetaceae bacterium]|nr:iron-binding protein [Planctomycetaceae bacterium]
MSDVKINIRDNGPLLVEGSFQLLDAEGNALPLAADKPDFALCRCGASANKPFCDGAHKSAGFEDCTRAPSE